MQFCPLAAMLLPLSVRPSEIFLINCIYAIQQPLLGHSIASHYAKNIVTVINNHVHVLVDKEVDAILRRCGLSDMMPLFHCTLKKESGTGSIAGGARLAESEETYPTALSERLKALFGLILGREGSLPEFQQMEVPKLRSEACVQVVKSLAEAYDVIYKVILDPSNGYPDPRL